MQMSYLIYLVSDLFKMILTPLVRWYQDLNKIYITIEVSDAKVEKEYFLYIMTSLKISLFVSFD